MSHSGASSVAPRPAPLPSLTLVLGGARSGKSRIAEELLSPFPSRLYMATGQAGDGEMAERIRLHRARRGEGWETVEEPLALPAALDAHAHPDRPILVDCLTLWVSNLLLAERPMEAEFDLLLDGLPDLKGPVVFVSNEVGLGIVPDNALARAFRDHAGSLNQRIAAHCGKVVFVAAGLPLVLKECP